jgi:hypothetical protein
LRAGTLLVAQVRGELDRAGPLAADPLSPDRGGPHQPTTCTRATARKAISPPVTSDATASGRRMALPRTSIAMHSDRDVVASTVCSATTARTGNAPLAMWDL